jgi:hypothetical protein
MQTGSGQIMEPGEEKIRYFFLTAEQIYGIPACIFNSTMAHYGI